jgi:hypothetical protein
LKGLKSPKPTKSYRKLRVVKGAEADLIINPVNNILLYSAVFKVLRVKSKLDPYGWLNFDIDSRFK